jgi:hypothetical protein
VSGSPLAQWGVGQLEIAIRIESLDPDGSADDREAALEEIDRMITRAHQLAVRLGVANSDAGLAAQSFVQLWNRGQLEVAAPLVAEASREGVPNPGWMAAAALAAATAGNLAEARAEANRVIDVFSANAESNWRLNAAAILVEAAAIARMPDAAAAAVVELQPRSGRCVVLGVGSVSLGPVDRYLGKAAAITGDADPIPLLESAVEQADRCGAKLWASRARADLEHLSEDRQV